MQLLTVGKLETHISNSFIPGFDMHFEVVNLQLHFKACDVKAYIFGVFVKLDGGAYFK